MKMFLDYSYEKRKSNKSNQTFRTRNQTASCEEKRDSRTLDKPLLHLFTVSLCYVDEIIHSYHFSFHHSSFSYSPFPSLSHCLKSLRSMLTKNVVASLMSWT